MKRTNFFLSGNKHKANAIVMHGLDFEGFLEFRPFEVESFSFSSDFCSLDTIIVNSQWEDSDGILSDGTSSLSPDGSCPIRCDCIQAAAFLVIFMKEKGR